jgi:hypothetical protein
MPWFKGNNDAGYIPKNRMEETGKALLKTVPVETVMVARDSSGFGLLLTSLSCNRGTPQEFKIADKNHVCKFNI